MEETRCRALEDYLAVVEPSGIDFGCGCAYEADNGGTPLPVNKFEPRDWPASRNSPKTHFKSATSGKSSLGWCGFASHCPFRETSFPLSYSAIGLQYD